MDPTGSDDFWKWSDVVNDPQAERKMRALGFNPEDFAVGEPPRTLLGSASIEITQEDLEGDLDPSSQGLYESIMSAEDEIMIDLYMRLKLKNLKRLNKRKAQRRARCGRRRK